MPPSPKGKKEDRIEALVPEKEPVFWHSGHALIKHSMSLDTPGHHTEVFILSRHRWIPWWP